MKKQETKLGRPAKYDFASLKEIGSELRIFNGDTKQLRSISMMWSKRNKKGKWKFVCIQLESNYSIVKRIK